MRVVVGLLITGLLVGCAGSPPKPPAPDGEYRPINRSIPSRAAPLNFVYEGDIGSVLSAMKDAGFNFDALPSVGTPQAKIIRLNLRDTTLEKTLKAIGDQCGDVAEVVWRATPNSGANEIFIRFIPAKKKSQ